MHTLGCAKHHAEELRQPQRRRIQEYLLQP